MSAKKTAVPLEIYQLKVTLLGPLVRELRLGLCEVIGAIVLA
jgi:hypothetical protein